MFWNSTTETERVRDNYKKLKDELNEIRETHVKLVDSISEDFGYYRSHTPFLEEGVIPSSDFTLAQERLDGDFRDYSKRENGYLPNLDKAISEAERLYEHYRQLAIEEENEGGD